MRYCNCEHTPGKLRRPWRVHRVAAMARRGASLALVVALLILVPVGLSLISRLRRRRAVSL